MNWPNYNFNQLINIKDGDKNGDIENAWKQ